MIIQDQFGTGLLNLDSVMGLAVKENENNNPGYVVATISVNMNEPNCIIGVYETPERAEEVLYSVRNAITTGETVYIMPTE